MKTYFKQLHEEIFQAYKSSKLLGHSLPKGQEREIITSRFLQRHLPSFIGIGQGVIADQSTTDFSKLTQVNSPQIDLLLAMDHHPTLTFYGGTKIFFAESIAAIIEVKSNLSTSELDKVLLHCNKVKQRTRQILGMYYGSPGPMTKIPYYVVAFECDKKADALINFLKERGHNQGLNEAQRLLFQPDGIFVLDPKNSSVIVKHIADHEIRPADFTDECYAGGCFSDGGVLLYLWLTLFQQIENLRLLRFPALAYAEKLLDITKSGDGRDG